MDNLTIYNALRVVPDEAKRAIGAGRLKGKTDINPMWRIKALTERFGPCGIGWRYEIVRQWTETGANGEISAFCNIALYVKHDGEWSAAIPGTGGSAMVASERNGLYTSDECYKMALTDALSVSCKALGVAADVYWDSDRTKYGQNPAAPPAPAAPKKPLSERVAAASAAPAPPPVTRKTLLEGLVTKYGLKGGMDELELVVGPMREEGALSGKPFKDMGYDEFLDVLTAIEQRMVEIGYKAA